MTTRDDRAQMKKPTVNGFSNCGNCYYYRNAMAKDFGYCRRFPPVVIATNDETVESEQPIVGKEHDACGEFTRGPKVVN